MQIFQPPHGCVCISNELFGFSSDFLFLLNNFAVRHADSSRCGGKQCLPNTNRTQQYQLQFQSICKFDHCVRVYFSGQNHYIVVQ